MTPPRAIPRVGVVTVTYNSASTIPDFMASLAAQRGVDVALYSVDNASTDGSATLIGSTAAGGIRAEVIASPTNVGVAQGNNLGIERALADDVDWVLLLNNDTVFGPRLIETLIRCAVESDVSLIAPVIEAIDPPGMLWYGGARMIRWQGYRVHHVGAGRTPARDRVTRQPAEETEYASTCCLLVAPEVFAAVGVMDASYFVYQDDVDFAVRARRAGYRFAVTSAAILTHRVGGATGGNRSEFSLSWGTRNWVLLARRYLSGPRLWLALAYMQCRLLGGEIRSHGNLRAYLILQRAFWRGLRSDPNDHDPPREVGR